MNHDFFRNCLFSKKEVIKTMTQLHPQCHQIVAKEIDKVEISSFDDKPFVLENGVSSLAYGHYKISTTVDETTAQNSGLLFLLYKNYVKFSCSTPTGFQNLYSVLVPDFSTTKQSLPVDSESCSRTFSSSIASTSLASGWSSESDSTAKPRGSLQRGLETLPSSSKFSINFHFEDFLRNGVFCCSQNFSILESSGFVDCQTCFSLP